MSELVRMIPEALSILIQVVVYFDRLNTFLLAEELGSNKIARSVKQSSVGDNNAVEIEDENFTWDSRPPAEVNLIEWLKAMVGNRNQRNSLIRTFLKSHLQRFLSFALLVALKCVDPDATKRPKIGQIIHMLEADEILFSDERRTGGESLRSHGNYHHEQKDSNRDRKRIGKEITD
ncbi:probable serine/threonine-protein kinase At1g01540 isoform X2 [Arachis stenosperma]|nr:probable serine/threonine-protein kinase At1g01540 isoform X2 [Arachis stenosperma]XP_057719075.1 probable serine/threonine-protein kinase At1g01540 isoform X2 [Arachis stenosperma]